ncbi:hypothetical protein [Streptomyces sp. NPDC051211]|uniref:hypothetical protein n=1 Tax=Streptomyces sp. NPDC051211 TaxID=3154643 RepID=UPI00344B6533
MRPPFRFPDDLLTLQETWQQTYADLAQGSSTCSPTVLRRRLIALSGRLYTHPYWTAPAGWRTGGVELRRAVRSHAPAATGREAA